MKLIRLGLLVLIAFLGFGAAVFAQPLTVNGVGIAPLCPGVCNGTIDLTISGGQQPYTVTWSNGSNAEDPGSLCPGAYTADVLDASGDFQTITIDVPEAVPVTLQLVNLADILCFGDNNGLIQVSASGGNPPYLYFLNGSLSPNSTGSFNNLSPGTYQITAEDANVCSAVQSFTINSPAEALSLIVNSKSDASCIGASNGSVNLSASGGTQPYRFSVNNGQSFQQSGVFNTLSAGTYTLVVQDANNCVAGQQSVTIAASAANYSVFAGKDTTICQTDTFTLQAKVANGVSGFVYNWQPATGLSATNILTPKVSNLKNATTYILSVSDPILGCVLRDTVKISVETPNFTGYKSAFILANNPNNLSLSANSTRQYLRVRMSDSSAVVFDTANVAGIDFVAYKTQERVLYHKITPKATVFPSLLPTYFHAGKGAVVIQDAQAVAFLRCDVLGSTPPAKVAVVEAEAAVGSLSIGGVVTKGVNGAGAKVSGLTLVLVNKSSGKAVAVTQTDAAGQFTFPNLAANTYQIWVDKPFVQNAQAPEITLGGQTGQTGLAFQLKPTQLVRQSVNAVEADAAPVFGFSAYPNPFSESLTVALTLSKSTEIRAEVVDLNGKVCQSRLMTAQPACDCRLEFRRDGLPSGVYVFRLTVDGQTFTRKVVAY